MSLCLVRLTCDAYFPSYFDYYHRSRTHLSLSKDSPDHREVQSADQGKVHAVAMVGGLHHRYTRTAA